MNLQEFQFPKVTGIDMAFSTIKTDPALLKEAHSRGFTNGNSPYERLASELFFNGGKLNFKKNIPDEFRSDATKYLKAFMASWEPKHEEKTSISALLLSELVDL